MVVFYSLRLFFLDLSNSRNKTLKHNSGHTCVCSRLTHVHPHTSNGLETSRLMHVHPYTSNLSEHSCFRCFVTRPFRWDFYPMDTIVFLIAIIIQTEHWLSFPYFPQSIRPLSSIDTFSFLLTFRVVVVVVSSTSGFRIIGLKIMY